MSDLPQLSYDDLPMSRDRVLKVLTTTGARGMT
jgi:hypothetical protein